MNRKTYDEAVRRFRKRFGVEPTVKAYAPGRIEVLGNHTDYNEGFVLSAAIDLGMFFLVAPSTARECRLVAGNLMEEAVFTVDSPAPSREQTWANYVKGVLAGLSSIRPLATGFNGLFFGDIPIAAGLSSSAALEVSCGLALAKLYRIKVGNLQLAKIGQNAEHKYAGVKCGLLDQISSLFGKSGRLVVSDFRSLKIKTASFTADVRLGAGDAGFLVFNTGVKHTLVNSEYNERRARCEEAADFFRSALDHPVTALRDVSWEEWEKFSSRMDPTTAKRAAHVIGENERVLKGQVLLGRGSLREFGELMFQSHDSSRKYFENSCPELDLIVDTARKIPEALGARLSGGGFGGSAIVLAGATGARAVERAVCSAYRKAFGAKLRVTPVHPSAGARAWATPAPPE